MKTLKLLTMIIVGLLCSTFLFSFQLTKEEYSKNLAKNNMNNICKNIALTDSQKQKIQLFVNEYERKNRNIFPVVGNPENRVKINQAFRRYLSQVDSLLTSSQKDTLKMKRLEYIEKQIKTIK